MACLSIYNLICSLEIGSARRQTRPSLSSSHTVWTDSVNIVCVMYKAEAGIIGNFARGTIRQSMKKISYIKTCKNDNTK